MIDSHCHLNLLDVTERPGGLDDVIEQAKLADVSHMLCIAVDLKSFPDVLACAERYDNVWATVGQHPNDAEEEGLASVEQLIQLAHHPKVIGIGETGLDYFRTPESGYARQHESFRNHIQVSNKIEKALIVHTRDAREDTINILREENAKAGVLHCFTESLAMAEQAMELGFYISFSGIVTFKNAKELQEVAKQIPLERILIETDSPYLAPVPNRGKPNEPAYVTHVAEFLAKLRDEPIEKITEQTTENFYTLFKHAS
tara:strand:- start:239734 stop:240507 length:774 start_codon:yes stop_codon:yes gene_type:complete